jgi:hypothetical protein
MEADMARKATARAEFVFFDVLYEDGTQRSNRRVPSDLLGGLDGDAPAREAIEEQDRAIAEKSGRPLPAIKHLWRSGDKKATSEKAIKLREARGG